MKTLLITTLFVIGSASTAFAGSGMGGANCSHAKKADAEKKRAQRRIAQMLNTEVSAKPASANSMDNSSRGGR